MKSIHFPSFQNIIHSVQEFHVHELNPMNLALRERVKAIAFSILIGIGVSRLVGNFGILVGVVTYFALMSCDKVGVVRVQKLQSERKEKETAHCSWENLSSIIKAVNDKILDPHLCFIKSNTDPFPLWFQKEYPLNQKSIQKSNLLYLEETCPEIKQGLFVSIRGDGDCTIRSIGAGLILQALSQDSKSSLEHLLEQFKQISIQLEKDASHLAIKIQELQISIDQKKKDIQQTENLLAQHSKHYRRENQTLNEEGQKLQASLDEKRGMVLILENHVKELQNHENQNQIQEQVIKLKSAYDNLSLLFNQSYKESHTVSELQKKIIELLEIEKFDQHLIKFLRKASSLHILLNMDKMGLLVKQLSYQEDVVLGTVTVFDLIMQRADARQPDQEYLQGSINDAWSLSLLFKQPISWYRCEVAFTPDERTLYHFSNEERQQKKKFYILNRPGHSDLILA